MEMFYLFVPEGSSTTACAELQDGTDKTNRLFNISYVMLCNVSCNFRCKVLVLSRYCTVDGDFLCLLYVSNVQKGLLSVYLLFLNYVLTYCKRFDDNMHAVWAISVTFRKKRIAIVLYEMCCVHNVHSSSSFCHYYMLFYVFEKHEKAWILICMYGIQYQKHKMSRNQFTAFWTCVCRSSGMQLVLTDEYLNCGNILPLTCFMSPLFTLRIL